MEGVQQGVQDDEPLALQLPAAHTAHAAIDAVPTILLKVPLGHGVALNELKGQKAPAGHITGAPELQ